MLIIVNLVGIYYYERRSSLKIERFYQLVVYVEIVVWIGGRQETVGVNPLVNE